ncbi:MAG: hypothetical protein RL149_712, partial [Actinomycetota bacterium]
KQATRALDVSLSRGQISMRGYDRCLRVAQTLADLDGASTVDESHIAQSVALRGPDQIARQAA